MSCTYKKRNRISNAKFREFLKLFCLDLTATQIATISHLNRLITLIRKHMVHLSEQQTRIGWVVESERKLLLALIGCVAIVGTEFRAIPLSLDSMNATDLSLLKSFYKGSFEAKVALESVIHSDGWLPCDGLVDLGHWKPPSHSELRQGIYSSQKPHQRRWKLLGLCQTPTEKISALG